MGDKVICQRLVRDEYGNEMKIGDHHEVYYWENPVSPGYTNDESFLPKSSSEKFKLYNDSSKALSY